MKACLSLTHSLPQDAAAAVVVVVVAMVDVAWCGVRV